MRELIGKASESVNKLVSTLEGRFSEGCKTIKVIQEDKDIGSLLCELIFKSKKALVWVRVNGRVSSIGGDVILLADGKRPKSNPNLDSFTQDRKCE
jgi:hypothetical protein